MKTNEALGAIGIILRLIRELLDAINSSDDLEEVRAALQAIVDSERDYVNELDEIFKKAGK